ncbi:MAG: nuclear transport factor 2 family protein, partial [Pseudomonadota bacterium]|nr:nuclear transport factor 2 family protein [Pseudomonadota bacterium]
MRRGLIATAGLVLALTAPLAGCGESRDNSASTAGDGGQTSAADIEAREAQMLRDIQSRNADAVANHYSEDATVIFPGEPPFRGRDAIAAEMRGLLQDPAFALDLTNEKTDVDAGGNLAYTRGTFQVTYTNSDTNTPE